MDYRHIKVSRGSEGAGHVYCIWVQVRKRGIFSLIQQIS